MDNEARGMMHDDIYRVLDLCAELEGPEDKTPRISELTELPRWFVNEVVVFEGKMVMLSQLRKGAEEEQKDKAE